MAIDLSRVLAGATPTEAQAVWQALAQYVENGLGRDDVDDPHAADPLLGPAEAVLDRMNAAVAALAE